ncbi:NAD(P)-binding protein [Desulfovibrio sp. OttesenSCG-928-M14]|nr:NAD(P)-binding protein [Desulfovibrio sp. OttesenSCG-928-M14]
MHGMAPARLLKWILDDLKDGSALGIVKELFFVPDPGDPFKMQRYGVTLETPLGVAAGPHTQMAQNIIAAWLCGARYMELKTVQVLDDITVTKPCIEMSDEGYNCEWSQELSLERSYREYLAAWVILHVLHDYLHGPGSPGMIFNMSAGYSLEGILSPQVQSFLDRMQNCGPDVEALKKDLAKVWPRAGELAIPGCMSDNLTISCMHGCPPDEVEKIALYFLQERKLNTTLKMNPTLLGEQGVRGLLNDTLGYDVNVPDIAFEHDLPYEEALRILRNCRKAAGELGLAFSVKLTNTLETANTGLVLPEQEKMVYMSGRALHPISIALAQRLQKDFKGDLDISFCAGIDALNVADVLACDLAPVTVCSDLLKPGGYGRLAQYMANIRKAMQETQATSLEAFVKTKAGVADQAVASLINLENYVEAVTGKDSRYAKKKVRYSNIKNSRPLPVLDCAEAPCKSNCPAGQDIPAYMERVAAGDPDGALNIILRTNPFPNVLGAMCNQACREKCIRVHYDEPLRIRDVKSCAAGASQFRPVRSPYNGRKVAVVGAGPKGLSCAFYLALAGCEVEVYEASSKAGGVVLGKLKKGADLALRDMEAIFALGVQLFLNKSVDQNLLEELAASRQAVYVAVDDDSSLAGAASLVADVGRGRRAAFDILGRLGLVPPKDQVTHSTLDLAVIRHKQAYKEKGRFEQCAKEVKGGPEAEASRCLQCDSYCGMCVSVCPNRANILLPGVTRSFPVQFARQSDKGVLVSTLARKNLRQTWQVMNIGDFCNECGNCAAFCPSAGAPYRDKFRLHLGLASYEADTKGMFRTRPGRYEGKKQGTFWSLEVGNGMLVYEDESMRAQLDEHSLEALHVELKGGMCEVSLLFAVQVALFCKLVESSPALDGLLDFSFEGAK